MSDYSEFMEGVYSCFLKEVYMESFLGEVSLLDWFKSFKHSIPFSEKNGDKYMLYGGLFTLYVALQLLDHLDMGSSVDYNTPKKKQDFIEEIAKQFGRMNDNCWDYSLWRTYSVCSFDIPKGAYPEVSLDADNQEYTVHVIDSSFVPIKIIKQSFYTIFDMKDIRKGAVLSKGFLSRPKVRFLTFPLLQASWSLVMDRYYMFLSPEDLVALRSKDKRLLISLKSLNFRAWRF